MRYICRFREIDFYDWFHSLSREGEGEFGSCFSDEGDPDKDGLLRIPDMLVGVVEVGGLHPLLLGGKAPDSESAGF